MKYCVFTLILILIACSNSEKKAQLPAKAPAVPVSNQPLETTPPNPNQIRLPGQIVSSGKMLLSFQTTGTIKSLIAKPGMFFKKGQLLAELDARDIALRAETARLQYEQALNARKIAERDFKIQQNLHAKGIGSQVDFDNARINFDNADLSVRAADANYRIAQKALDDTQLKAPFDCVITRQLKVLGESSIGGVEGNTVYELYETAKPEIRLQAPENLLGLIEIGTHIDIRIPALKINLAAKVVRYVPVISEQTRNFLVVAEFDQNDSKIVPGYFVEGTLQ